VTVDHLPSIPLGESGIFLKQSRHVLLGNLLGEDEEEIGFVFVQ